MAINYNTRVSIKKKGEQVRIRVRWNGKKDEAYFSTGIYADPAKWNTEGQRPKLNTTHIVNGVHYSSREIHVRIGDYLSAIDNSFRQFELKGKMPTSKELVSAVNSDSTIAAICGVLPQTREKTPTSNPKEILKVFLATRALEANWSESPAKKYRSLFRILKEATHKEFRFEDVDREFMNTLKKHLVDCNYANITISRNFGFLKTFLRWVEDNGYYTFPVGVLHYSTNLNSSSKVVVRLEKAELLQFMSYEYSPEQKNLETARDLFCLMSLTALRWSDLMNLRLSNYNGKSLELYAKKTKKSHHIPLNSISVGIIEKYKGCNLYAKDKTIQDKLLPQMWNESYNRQIKEAARVAGLNREIQLTKYCGSKRTDVTVPLYKCISAHAGRRTFISQSLEMGIPTRTVMSITGHSSERSMLPYIDVASSEKDAVATQWDSMLSTSMASLASIPNAIKAEIGTLTAEQREALKLLLK